MSSKAQRLRPIALASIGEIESELMSTVADDIRAVLGRDVVLAEGLPIPAHSFSRQRGQWHATTILDALAAVKRPEWLRLLGIVDVDLYAPQLNFVFGEADADRRVAVFSTARLRVRAEGATGAPAPRPSTSWATHSDSGTAHGHAARCGSPTRSPRRTGRTPAHALTMPARWRARSR